MRTASLIFICLLLCPFAYAQDEPVEPTDASEVAEPAQASAIDEEPPTSAKESDEPQAEDSEEPVIKIELPPTNPVKKLAQPEINAATAPSEPTSKERRIIGDLGLELSLGTGLNLCVPRGDASCTDLLPGPYYEIGFQYRFWQMGLAFSYASGMHIPIGTGAENVSVGTQHIIMDIKGYFPKSGALEPFAGLGLGFGNVIARDTSSDSRVEWSSLWQTARLSGGVRGRLPDAWLPGTGWFWEAYGALYLHQGGERCVFYAAQGACRATDDLSGGDTDYASTLELGGRMGWSF